MVEPPLVCDNCLNQALYTLSKLRKLYVMIIMSLHVCHLWFNYKFSFKFLSGAFNPSMRNTWWLPSEHLYFSEHRLRNPAVWRGGFTSWTETKWEVQCIEFRIIGAANETDGDHLMNKFQVSKDRISQSVFSGVFRGKPADIPRKATRTTYKFSQFTNMYTFSA